MENKNPNVDISLELVNAVLAYLGKRPFEEVQGLIGALQQQAQASMQAKQQASQLAEVPDSPEEAAKRSNK